MKVVDLETAQNLLHRTPRGPPLTQPSGASLPPQQQQQNLPPQQQQQHSSPSQHPPPPHPIPDPHPPPPRRGPPYHGGPPPRDSRGHFGGPRPPMPHDHFGPPRMRVSNAEFYMYSQKKIYLCMCSMNCTQFHYTSRVEARYIYLTYNNVGFSLCSSYNFCPGAIRLLLVASRCTKSCFLFAGLQDKASLSSYASFYS